MERRRFIFYLTNAAAGATIFIACQNRHRPAVSRMAQPDFLLQVSDTAAIRAIGETYRKQTPAESQPNQLTALLNDRISPQSIEQEYAAGETVTINGWILSRTEARQCALYSIESR